MSLFDYVIKLATRLLLDPVIELLSGFAGAKVEIAHLSVIHAFYRPDVILIDSKSLIHRKIVAHHYLGHEMSHILAVESICR